MRGTLLPPGRPRSSPDPRAAPSSLLLVRVYYTDLWAKRRYRGERFIYHAMRDCPAGKRIKGKHRTTAPLPLGGRRPCPECTALARDWLELATPRPVAS